MSETRTQAPAPADAAFLADGATDPLRRVCGAATGWGCACHGMGRRRFAGFTGLLLAGAAVPATGQAAIAECKRSRFTKAVPAATVENAATQQYQQMLQEASGQRALAPANHPQLQRLRFIADRIVPFTSECNDRARQWKWEVNLLGSADVNAFCMPGGKIAFYYGILDKLQLDDDEVATIMGHEVAHALLEHAREQAGKNTFTQLGLRLGASLLGLGSVGDAAAQIGSQLLSLRYSRDDETEADALGLVMSARAGYNPRAGVSLWQKMMAASGGSSPPKILSTHPTSRDRISAIEARLARLMPTFEAAAKPGRRFGPPQPSAKSGRTTGP
jgi:Zn-dependent protease with chaperone function